MKIEYKIEHKIERLFAARFYVLIIAKKGNRKQVFSKKKKKIKSFSFLLNTLLLHPQQIEMYFLLD